MNRRKRICPCCGRKLWLCDFYTKRSSYCKDCEKRKKRESYHGRPEGTYLDAKSGRLWTHEGYATRLHWSRDMLDYLIAHFPTSRNEELASELGVSPRTLIRKAREKGLRKSSSWMRGVWDENRILANVEARRLGHPGTIRKGEHRSPATEFKPKISIH